MTECLHLQCRVCAVSREDSYTVTVRAIGGRSKRTRYPVFHGPWYAVDCYDCEYHWDGCSGPGVPEIALRIIEICRKEIND